MNEACIKNGIQCACAECFDTKCKAENCGICCDSDEYWKQCPARRDTKLDLTNTKEVLKDLQKCIAGHLVICKMALERGEILTLKGEKVSEEEREVREAMQKGRIESYENCLGYVNGLLKEMEETENSKDNQDIFQMISKAARPLTAMEAGLAIGEGCGHEAQSSKRLDDECREIEKEK